MWVKYKSIDVTMRNKLLRIVGFYGSIQIAAKQLNLHRTTIYNWIRPGGKISIAKLAAIDEHYYALFGQPGNE